jgi:hypothetical protein
VGCVEFTKFVRSGDIFLRDPCILFVPVSCPLYKELKLASYKPAVQDFLYYVVLFSIDNLRWRWRMSSSSRNRVFRCREKLHNVEDGVESGHGSQKSETVHILPYPPLHHIRFEVAVGRLLRRTCGADITHV